jgi:protein-disulfide isomerase
LHGGEQVKQLNNLFGGLLAMALVGCVSQADVDRLDRNQEAIQRNQSKILAKLEQLAKAKPTEPKKQPPKPDPKVTYSFPVTGSPIKGSKDAWVTLVEVSDFQ